MLSKSGGVTRLAGDSDAYQREQVAGLQTQL